MLAAGFASAASLGKLVPHLDWLAARYGVPLGMAGLAVSCVMLPGALAGWTFGAASDRYGAKRVAIAGLITAAVASAGAGLVDSFALLVLLRIVEGVGYTLLVVAATVIAAGVMPGKSAIALSVWSSFAPIGFALGQWAAAYAASDSPLKVIGLVHAAVLVLAALALYLIVDSAAQDQRAGSMSRVLRHAPARRAALAFGATCAVLLAAVALAPVVLASRAGMTVAEVAALTALAALVSIVGRVAPGWLLDRGAAPLALFSWASVIAALAITVTLALPVTLWFALILFALFQIAAGALPGILSAMIPYVSPGPGELGSTSGLCAQMVNVGNLVGPPLALAIYAGAGANAAAVLLVALLGLAVAAIAGLAVFRRRLSQAA